MTCTLLCNPPCARLNRTRPRARSSRSMSTVPSPAARRILLASGLDLRVAGVPMSTGSVASSSSAARSTAPSTAIVRDRLASNVPSARWYGARIPAIRSYPTVTLCAHHGSTPCTSRRYRAIAV